jgi:hypothetical protein
VPAFVVASAAESKPLNLEGVPQWRITAGNLAAGATAGCAVEAGGSFPVHAAALWHARIALRSSLGACLTSTERGGMSMCMCPLPRMPPASPACPTPHAHQNPTCACWPHVLPALYCPALQPCTPSTPSRPGCRRCARGVASARCCRRAAGAACTLGCGATWRGWHHPLPSSWLSMSLSSRWVPLRMRVSGSLRRKGLAALPARNVDSC